MCRELRRDGKLHQSRSVDALLSLLLAVPSVAVIMPLKVNPLYTALLTPVLLFTFLFMSFSKTLSFFVFTCFFFFFTISFLNSSIPLYIFKISFQQKCLSFQTTSLLLLHFYKLRLYTNIFLVSFMLYQFTVLVRKAQLQS